ncbi:MAG: mechanosensitive ion channel family protein [Eubacteriales bacterium]|nr:mechanosensitive ion channel family protein [Eubacteriales bacterium]
MLLRALTVEGSGIMTTDDAMEATNDVTNSAIEGVQTVTSFFHLPTWFGRLVFIIIAILAMLTAVRIVNNIFRRTIESMEAAGNTNVTLISFARYIILTGIYFIGGVVVISSIPGASDSLTALLASGGIVAVIVGFAAQDTLGNVAGGVMILFFKPFVIGDFVRYDDVTGTIEEITLRHTVIRTPANKRIIIPNGTINGGILENAHYGDKKVCEFFDVGITYESDMEKAIAVLRDEVMKQPLHLDVRTTEAALIDPEVKVEVVELADSAVVLRAWLWAADQNNASALKFSLNRSVKNRFDKEGIEFAYPHITVSK